MVAPLTIYVVLGELERGDTSRVLELRELVLQARRETEQDLASQDICDELRLLMEAMVEDYQLLTAILRSLSTCAPEQIPALAQELAEADAQLAETEAAMTAWESRLELRCPACGEPGAVCELHGVEGLIPDASFTPAEQGADLGDNYVVAFQAYQGVLEGELPLTYLEEALSPLEMMLRRFVSLASAEAGVHGASTADALERISRASSRSLQGLKRMRQCTVTRETRDLNAGWAEVFSQAREIQECVPIIARAFGGDVAASHRQLAAVASDNTSDIDFD